MKVKTDYTLIVNNFKYLNIAFRQLRSSTAVAYGKQLANKIQVSVLKVSLALFTLLAAVAFSKNATAQCSFSATASMLQESECQSSGVVKVELSGAGVDSKAIRLSDAKYSIASTTTSYRQPPMANNGTILNVPPGSYTVEVQAYCSATHKWETRTSNVVVVTGSYTVPDINKIFVATSGIEKSLKCAHTGSIPLKVEGGKAPYQIRMVNAPSSYAGPLDFVQPEAGTYTIGGLPAGAYEFEVSDNCTYTLMGMRGTVGEVDPKFYIDSITPTTKCGKNGAIDVVIRDGAAPYTVDITSYPSGYTGSLSFSVLHDDTLTLKKLPIGKYQLKVSDKCYSQELTAVVDELAFEASLGNIESSLSCDATGSIDVLLSGGEAPYSVEIKVTSGSYSGPLSFTSATEGVLTIPNLPAGTYKITAKDACGTQKVLGSQSIVAAVLNVSLVSKVDAQGCGPTGSAVLSILNGKPSYTIKLLSTTAIGYTSPFPQTASAPTESYPIASMPPGVYKFEVEDACGTKQAVEVAIGMENMLAFVTEERKTFVCVATGILIVTVTGGDPPYSLVVNSAPPAYTGPTSGFAPTTLPNGNEFNLGELPAGTYHFTVTDNCGSTATAVGVVNDLVSNFPKNAYFDYFLPPDPPTPNSACSKVRIRRNTNIEGDLEDYWNALDSAKIYYEVAYTEKGYAGPLSWQPIQNVKDTTISLSYCNARKKSHYYVVHMRVRNDSGLPSCGTYTDTVWLAQIESKLGNPYNQSCASFDVNFSQYNDHRGVFCYPYSWVLENTETGTDTSISGGPVYNANEQTVTNIPPGEYRFRFTDSGDCTWYSDTIRGYWSKSPTADIKATHQCLSYKLLFSIGTLCSPYSWTLVDLATNAVIDSKHNIQAVGALFSVGNLRYGTDYLLNVVYKNRDGNDTTSFSIREEVDRYYNYKLGSGLSFCLPDTSRGYMYIERDHSMPAFEKGSQVEFISGPTTPIHKSIKVEGSNVTRLYPFSADSLAMSYQPILPGNYQFMVTDSCGVTHRLSLNYEKLSLRDFGYTRDTACNGMHVYPRGTIYLGNTPQPTYFRICETPQGIAVDTASVVAPGYLFIPESGRYGIQVSLENRFDSCPFDTLYVDYSKLSIALDTEATRAYVCREGELGFIQIKSVGGIGPFEYELFDNGVSQGVSKTGAFSYGSPGETYTIRIKDKGCRVAFDQSIMLINLANPNMIYGSKDVCYGGSIELSCTPLSSTYSWTGPNGFSSLKRNPKVDNVTFDNGGTYSISIEPEGCNGAITQSINITIHKPSPPATDSVSVVCLNAQPLPLSATPSQNHYLKWYAPDSTTLLGSAPALPTSKADTATFYVSQVDHTMGCESDKVPAVAAVSDLPARVPLALGPPVCPNTYPTFIIPLATPSYTYNVYDAPTGGTIVAGKLAESGSATTSSGQKVGSSLSMKSSHPIVGHKKTYYVEVINELGCIANDRTPVTVKAENYLYIKPDVLPEYKLAKPYSVQLASNAVSPYVYSSSSMPFGFNLSASGVISADGSISSEFGPISFDVSLVDGNGCVAQKTYQLFSEPFIPQVFTPDGNRVNEFFMKGKHVIIFDRLGVVIFEGNDGWDGTRNGQPAPPDTYFYLLDHVDPVGQITQRKGYITLMRGSE